MSHTPPPDLRSLVLGRYRFLKSVSVFGIFFGFFQKSVRFSVSAFQNIAISVRFFGFIYLFANLHVGAQLIRYCIAEAHLHIYDTITAFQEEMKNSRSFKFLPETGLVRDINEPSNEFQTTRRKGTRTKSHCSRPRYSKFQMRR